MRNLVQTQTRPGDDAASTLIRFASGRQPSATYLLVQRALILESAREVAQARIDQLEGRVPDAVVARPSADFLDPAAAVWGEKVDRNGQRSRDKKLYDMFKELQSSEGTDLESRAVNFLSKNAGKVCLFILVLAGMAVLLR